MDGSSPHPESFSSISLCHPVPAMRDSSDNQSVRVSIFKLQVQCSCHNKEQGCSYILQKGEAAAMDPSYPDWSLESDLLPFTNQKKPSSTNDELMELIWQNGQVVMQSQTRGRPGLNHLGSQQLPKKSEANYHYQNTNGSYANSSTLIQDDETVSWINYPVDDPLEEFCSPFFTANLPSPCPIETVAGKPAKTMARQGPWASQFGGAGDVRECSGMTIGSSHCESNQVIQNESDFSRASSIGTNKMRSCYSQHFT
ncbi:hypothetical protein SAY86_029179 [Trapa natans]|uniref:Uncharacterized protein n=1 Tax=Trapa natans TaxID=22666 RepID=A0AAN7MKM1_TRANT|nr:hypothetical protein SAY86_029179 [Trapa natans]